ncbi:MlaD family protein [Mycobacteroides abscessus]|uniref:MlaD family protein n=1 Tax=Mycobacteroides abscessus TaxID=36809 RepID=UPI0013FD083E|nr:MlaD family protein [Mycobacteroides abscessus]
MRVHLSGEARARTRHIAVAVGVYVVAALLAVTTGIAYLRPPGHRTVVFAIQDGASIKLGADVRVAGISVGKVARVRLVDDTVRVELNVDNDVYLGDQTAVDIRMLTAAGGYSVNLMSKGVTPLHDTVIPADRAHSPYQLPQLLADTATKFQRINAEQFGANLDKVASGLEANPGALTELVQGMEVVTQIMSRQRDQLQLAFDTTTELTSALNANREMLLELVRETAITLAELDKFKYGVAQSSIGLGRLLTVIGDDAVRFYDSHRDWVLDVLQRTNNALNVINTDISRIIWNLGNFVNNLRDWVSPSGLRLVPQDDLLATDLCVPTSERPC